MSPTRRHFLKSAAATIAAASFTWPQTTAANEAARVPSPFERCDLSIVGEAGVREIIARWQLAANGDLYFVDIVTDEPYLIAHGTERLAPAALIEQFVTVYQTSGVEARERRARMDGLERRRRARRAAE